MKKVVSLFTLLLLLQPSFAHTKPAKKASPTDIEMVAVQGGKFDMGSDDDQMDRRPAHTVTLKDFSIGKYEITERQWKAVMDSNPSVYTYCNDCPITNVSWNDIQAFLKKLNEKTGKHYRLPTEAEWEYAARGGAKEIMRKDKEDKLYGKKHSGKQLLQTIAWYDGNAKDHVHPVGRKKGNELELHDMTGNVEEWCNDWYGKDYVTKKDVTDPQGPDGGTSKVVRGGSWYSQANETSVTRRAAYLPDTKTMYLGFRVVDDSK